MTADTGFALVCWTALALGIGALWWSSKRLDLATSRFRDATRQYRRAYDTLQAAVAAEARTRALAQACGVDTPASAFGDRGRLS